VDTLRALQNCLATDGTQLGHGRDVVEHGRYSRLELSIAWRIEHPFLWRRYANESGQICTLLRERHIKCPSIHVRSELQNATAQLPGKLREEINEVRLLHGTTPDPLLGILTNGINERFSDGLFGAGSYFAEDAGKNDQYVTSDRGFAQEGLKDLHERLFRDGLRHPEEPLFFLIVCRVVLGHCVRTKDGETALDDGSNLYANRAKRELAAIPGLKGPPVHHHALLAEIGGKILRHREFIQFHDARIYPEYLIAYTRK
jgi:hypothetical protein